MMHCACKSLIGILLCMSAQICAMEVVVYPQASQQGPAVCMQDSSRETSPEREGSPAGAARAGLEYCVAKQLAIEVATNSESDTEVRIVTQSAEAQHPVSSELKQVAHAQNTKSPTTPKSRPHSRAENRATYPAIGGGCLFYGARSPSYNAMSPQSPAGQLTTLPFECP